MFYAANKWMLIRNPASSRELHAVSLRSTIISFVIDDVLAFYAVNILRGEWTPIICRYVRLQVLCFTIIRFVIDDAKSDYAQQMKAITPIVAITRLLTYVFMATTPITL